MNRLPHFFALLCLLIVALSPLALALHSAIAMEGMPSFATSIDRVQPKLVKIYGAGGFRGLEAYQSGFLISSEGHVLTVWSYVLDTDAPRVTLNDGRRFDAEILGVDPWLEIAVLKFDGNDLAHFSLEQAAEGQVGERILAFSNLFGVATGSEPASVQRGVISAVTQLKARRGVFQTQYAGPVYVLDAMTNNPGAAGGGLTALDGRLLGLLGKELKNRQDNTWLNYALPVDAVRDSVAGIIAGQPQKPPEPTSIPVRKPVDLPQLGVDLVPHVVDGTPPFVDAVRPGSAAAKAGLRPDDLILFVGDVLVQSINDLDRQCGQIESGNTLLMLVRRGEAIEKIELETESSQPRRPRTGESFR